MSDEPRWADRASRRSVTRAGLGVVAASLAGCASSGQSDDRPSGEIDLKVTTESSRDHEIVVEILDARGEVEADLSSELPSDITPGPSLTGLGYSNGPYTISVAIESDEATYEWDVEACPQLALAITVTETDALDLRADCSE